jgi:hypothetical protein
MSEGQGGTFELDQFAGAALRCENAGRADRVNRIDSAPSGIGPLYRR